MCGIEPVFASEIEPFPIRVTTKRLPEMKHYGDVSQLNGAELEPVDIITFGSPCFLAGTLINTDRGMVEIENVVNSDMVLTHQNRYRKVISTMTNYSLNSLREINIVGRRSTFVTDEHPYYVRTMRRDYSEKTSEGKRTSKRTWSEPYWKEAKDIDIYSDYVGISINQESINSENLTDEECWLLGRYVADGYLRNGQRSGRPEGQTHGQVVFCVGKQKIEHFTSQVKEYHLYCTEERTAVKAKITNKKLTGLAEACGKGASNKVIPQFIMNLPVPQLELFLEGYMSGDGHSKDGKFKASSVSKKLIYQLAQVVAKVYKTPSNIYFFARKPQCIIEGRTVNQKDTWMISFTKETRKQNNSVFLDGMLWSRVKTNKRVEYSGTVYNLEVEEDNSYTANNITVHNCQDLSVAGKREGLSGEKSNLFYQAIRIIKEMRSATNGVYPRYAVWENVPGAFSSNKGEDFHAVLEAFCQVKESGAVIPRPKRWADSGLIVADGHSVAWRVLDAQFWGRPQRRQRIFLVADFAGQSASQIFLESTGLPRDSATGREAWENVTESSEVSTRTTGSNSVITFRDVASTLRAGAGAPKPEADWEQLICTADNTKVFALQGNMIGRTDKNGPQGDGINEDVSFTLNTTDRHAVVYAICSDGSNSMKSKNPHSGIYEANTTRTLDQNGGNPACNQGGMMIVQPLFVLNDQGGTQMSITEDMTATLRAEAHGNNPILFEPRSQDGLPRIHESGIVPTLNTAQGGQRQPCVASFTPSQFGQYTEGVGTLRSSGGDLGGGSKTILCTTASGKDVFGTLQANCGQKQWLGNQEAFSGDYHILSPHHTVRRLTPLECCRLQGFPDGWATDLGTENPTEEDILFWQDVFETHRKIMGTSSKPKSRKQIIKWLKNPHSDSAEYKMWGNGVALPCVFFILQQIKI